MKKHFEVHRFWTVEYRSVAYVEAESAAEACRVALEDDDDYSDAQAVDGSEGPTEIGRVIEITKNGKEIEHSVPSA